MQTRKNSAILKIFLLVSLFFMLGGFSGVKAAETIKQWEIYELEFVFPGSYDWNEFPLQVTFQHGSDQIIIEGFWDGGNTWKVRFTPTFTGTWTWNSPWPDIQGRTTDYLDVVLPSVIDINNNSNYRGHLKTSNNQRYFEYADGEPFFWLGDTNWGMNTRRCGLEPNPDYDNQRPFYYLLQDRESKGFTVIQAQLFSIANQENEGGHAFFGNTTSPGNGNFGDLNPAYFQALDQRIRAIWEGGFVLAVHPTWFGEIKISLGDAEKISRYLLDRYGAYNIVWSLSGEYQYSYIRPSGPWVTNDWNELGNFVHNHNVYHHPVSVHTSGRTDWEAITGFPGSGEQSSGGEFHNQSWLDHNWLQTGHGDNYLWRVAQRTLENYFNYLPYKSVVHSEGFYENINEEGASNYEIRWQAWTAYLNGAAGHTYGANGVWQFYDPNDPQSTEIPYDETDWRDALAYSGSSQLGQIVDFFKKVDFVNLIPHRDWLIYKGSEPALPSEENLEAPHLAAIPGQVYVVYLPQSNPAEQVTITHLENKTYQASWFNPRSGDYQDINYGEPVNSDLDNEWLIPERPDNQDWVVILSQITDACFTENLFLNWLDTDPVCDLVDDNKVNGLDFAELLLLE